MRAILFSVALSIAILAILPEAAAAARNVTLGWDSSASSDVAGYNIYYGLESGNYPFKIPAGTNTCAAINGLVEGMTYYIVVTAYDSSGVESDPSNEIGFTVPGVAAPGTPWFKGDPASGSVYLTWSPSPSPEVAGYDVLFSAAGGSGSELIFSGNTTELALSSLALAADGSFSVKAYDYYGQESADTATISSVIAQPNAVGGLPAPVLSLKQTPAAGLPGVFSVTASGVIPPAWALEASSDFQSWGTVTTGSNSAVNVTVVVSPKPRLFFRLDSSLPGVRMQTQKPADAFPNAFSFSTPEAAPPLWIIQASEDLLSWNNLATGSGTDLNVAVVPTDAPRLFFRLKSR